MIQSIGAVGGSVGTAFGFALPMLYFLDKHVFNTWLANPWYFCSSIAALCFCAGALGISLGRLYSYSLITKLKLPFPVSQLTANIVTAQNQVTQAWQVIRGIVITAIFLILRDGIGKIGRAIPKIVYLFPQYFRYEFAIHLWPTLWAIGFISGPSIAIPLLVGVFSKYGILWPLNHHANYLPWHFFLPSSSTAFAFAFCCGIVVFELIFGLYHNYGNSLRFIKKISKFLYFKRRQMFASCKDLITGRKPLKPRRFKLLKILEPLIALAATVLLLSKLKFCVSAQLVLILLCTLATYQICFLGGKIGLIHFGRFSTYVMVPMVLLYQLTFLQITVICVFFNVCAAVASDLLFDYKTGQLCNIKQNKTHLAQWLGLLAITISIGFIFWLLFTNLRLGTSEFFACRGRTKALLIQTLYFEPIVVMLGFVYGFILKKCRLNPSIVFGGIIMPNSISIGIILGSLTTFFMKEKESYHPFCAGIFTGESLWILGGLVSRLF
jgi:hypothetical protein